MRPIPGKLLCLWLLASLLYAGEQMSATLSRTTLYPGEPALLSVEFHAQAPAQRLEVTPPKLNGFIVEKIDENRSVHQNLYDYRAHWLLIPKAPGSATLPPVRLLLYRLEPGSYIAKKVLFQSAPARITVLPLPPGIDFAGDLRMSARLDRNATRAGRPVQLILRIRGRGDLRTLKLPRLTLADAQVYPARPIVKTGITPQGNYGGEIIRRYTILAKHDLQIPSLSLRYLNSSTGTVERLQTPAFHLRVDNPLHRAIRRNRLWGFLSGLAAGALLALAALWLLRRRKPDSDLRRRIRRARNARELYHLLLPYGTHPQIRPYLDTLEATLYRGAEIQIDKKALIETLERIVEG